VCDFRFVFIIMGEGWWWIGRQILLCDDGVFCGCYDCGGGAMESSGGVPWTLVFVGDCHFGVFGFFGLASQETC
jgi:hypothetical protein